MTSSASTLPKQELPLTAQLHVLLQITVDGDTSTNDTCIGLASGAAGNELIKHSTSEAAQKLEAAVTALLQVLQLPTHRCVV
jgi:N-acetylglutamate synthase/N-acetylornithine aminotransferase